MASEGQAIVALIASFLFPLFAVPFVIFQESKRDSNIAAAGLGMGLAFAFFVCWLVSL
jgi:hypothetical protein